MAKRSHGQINRRRDAVNWLAGQAVVPDALVPILHKRFGISRSDARRLVKVWQARKQTPAIDLMAAFS